MKLKPSKYIHKTMLVQLITYFVLVITIALCASSYFTYIYFSSSFKDEITDFNHMVLKQVSMISDKFIIKNVNELALNQILDTSKSPALKTIYNKTSFDDWKEIFDVQYELNNLVFQSRDVVDSIFIHSRSSGLLISSSPKVLKYIDEKSISAADEFSWIDTFYKSNKSILWLNTRHTRIYSSDFTSMGDIITIICSYPASSSGGAAKGLIAVNIKEDALSNYLVKFSSSGAGQFMILDGTGTIVAHSSKLELYDNVQSEPFVKTILSSSAAGGFKTTYKNTEYVVSYEKSDFNNWYYVSLIPSELFYQKDDLIKKNIFAVSFGILIILFILSNFLSFNIYTPFKKILEKYSKIAGTYNAPKKGLNEYNQLDSLFSNVFTRLNDLQATLNKNYTMIRHNLFTDLLKNRHSTHSNLQSMLKLLGIHLDNKYYCAVVFAFEYGSSLSELNKIPIYKYSIIDFISTFGRGSCGYIPVDIGKDSICVIINTSTDGNEDITDFVRQVDQYSRKALNIKIKAGIGSFTDDLLSINNSYINAKICLQYKFILPDKDIFYFSEVGTAGSSLPADFTEKFEKFLKLGSYADVKKTLDRFLTASKIPGVPYREVRQAISGFVSIYMSFLESMKINSEDILCEEDRAELHSPQNIEVFVCTFLSIIQRTNSCINAKKQSKNRELANRIKQYVLENIDQEISLNSTAEAFHISSFHLSKIFKEEIGINYIDFVINCKMDKAKNLLVSTNLSINRITSLIGYSHSTYFTRKFKELTGKTPNVYRSDALMQAKNPL